MEEILQKLPKKEFERYLILFGENIHNFFLGKFSVNLH